MLLGKGVSLKTSPVHHKVQPISTIYQFHYTYDGRYITSAVVSCITRLHSIIFMQ